MHAILQEQKVNGAIFPRKWGAHIMQFSRRQGGSGSLTPLRAREKLLTAGCNNIRWLAAWDFLNNTACCRRFFCSHRHLFFILFSREIIDLCLFRRRRGAHNDAGCEMHSTVCVVGLRRRDFDEAASAERPHRNSSLSRPIYFPCIFDRHTSRSKCHTLFGDPAIFEMPHCVRWMARTPK